MLRIFGTKWLLHPQANVQIFAVNFKLFCVSLIPPTVYPHQPFNLCFRIFFHHSIPLPLPSDEPRQCASSEVSWRWPSSVYGGALSFLGYCLILCVRRSLHHHLNYEEYFNPWTTKSGILTPQLSKTSQITPQVVLNGGFATVAAHVDDDMAMAHMSTTPSTIPNRNFPHGTISLAPKIEIEK